MGGAEKSKAIGLIIALCSSQSLAKGLDWEGRVESGVVVKEFRTGSFATDMTLKLDSDRHEGVKAKAELKGDAITNEVEWREAYIDYELSSGVEWRFGQMEKRFGLEWELSHRKRLHIRRSAVYTKLESISFVGHEPRISYRSMDRRFTLSLGIPESTNANFIAHWGPEGDEGWDGWVLVQTEKMASDRIYGWGLAGAYRASLGAHAFQAQAIVGTDTKETQFERVLGDGQPVHFGSLSVLYGIGSAHEEAVWRIFNLLGIVIHDVTLPKYNTLEVGMGYEYWIGKLRLAAAIHVLGSNSEANIKRRALDQSKIDLGATFYF